MLGKRLVLGFSLAGLLIGVSSNLAMAGKPPDLPVILHDHFLPMVSPEVFMMAPPLTEADCPAGPVLTNPKYTCPRDKSAPVPVSPFDPWETHDVLSNLAGLLSPDEVTQVSERLREKGIDPTEGKKWIPEHGNLTIGFSFFPVSIHVEIVEARSEVGSEVELQDLCGEGSGVAESVDAPAMEDDGESCEPFGVEEFDGLNSGSKNVAAPGNSFINDELGCLEEQEQSETGDPRQTTSDKGEEGTLLNLVFPEIDLSGMQLRIGWQVLVGPWSCQIRYDRASLSLETQLSAMIQE